MLYSGETIVCPRCGKSHYKQGPTLCTAMYFAPVMQDGVNINPDRNVSTTECMCLECGTPFRIKRCCGAVLIEKADEGQ